MRRSNTSYRKTGLLSTEEKVSVLIIGSGGREHALAWKLAQSPRVGRVFVAPGNGGTEPNVGIGAEDVEGLLRFARENGVDLTVVGPEAPLVGGIADVFRMEGLRIFGPTRAAAQLEGSKAFAKEFMLEEGIPTGRAEIFDDYDAALAYLRTQATPIVIKASGLAAGKGVTVCPTMAEAEAALRAAMVERVFGAAGNEVLIEECLFGPEASLLAFCDGQTAVPMVVARDHKAAFDGDRGPNTGGMGCYAPAPIVSPALRDEVMRTVIQPAVAGMRRRGTPYVGVLYAGLILTGDGPKVLEFNCRFGDPETQVVLPLLDGDLLDVLEACVDGRLAGVEVRWRDGYCVCVVLASAGYPGAYEKGKVISGVDEAEALDDVMVFHAGTRRDGRRLLTNGGRVLGVTAWGATLPGAIETAYRAVQRIEFEGMWYRRDIGAKGVAGP